MASQLLRSLTIFWLAFRLLVDYLWLDFSSRFRSDAAQRAADQRAFARWGRMMRRAAIKLGGVIIKVGQFLSTRADMLPDVFTKELASLQDAVPSAPFAAVKRQMEDELGAPLNTFFAVVEEAPLASASLGQVHRATLKEGQVVAIKVLRPGIERLVAVDLAALRRVLGWAKRWTALGRRFDLDAVMDEFETTTLREMDYLQEAEHIRKFRHNLRAVPGVDVPFPFDNLVTRRTLVMEYIDGMKLTERDRLQAAGINSVELAHRLVDAYLQQVLVDGFVHVDPHPGNLLVRPDGTVVLLDFGMVASITAKDKKGVADLATGLLTRNLDNAVQALRDLEVLRPHADAEVLKQALALILDRFQGTKLEMGPEFDRFLVQFREWLYEEPLQFPSRYIFLFRAVGLLVGLAVGLDPNIDWVGVCKERALPMLTQATAGPSSSDSDQGFNWKKTLQDLVGPSVTAALGVAWKEVSAAGMSLVRVPTQLEHVLQKADSGALKVQVDLGDVSAQLARNGSRSAWSVVAAGAGIAGAMLRVGGFALEAKVAWGVAGFALLLLLLNSRSGGGGRRRGSFHGKARRSR
ncbi:MAG TPA: AarF/UbiB family protein [Symbiobacteriaceae bacterium]|nr:AarF/UbiB family protein [Symbiobacteriaceae bacterium]